MWKAAFNSSNIHLNISIMKTFHNLIFFSFFMVHKVMVNHFIFGSIKYGDLFVNLDSYSSCFLCGHWIHCEMLPSKLSDMIFLSYSFWVLVWLQREKLEYSINPFNRNLVSFKNRFIDLKNILFFLCYYFPSSWRLVFVFTCLSLSLIIFILYLLILLLERPPSS